MNNFVCLDCGEQFYVPQYSTIIIAGEPVYKVKGSLMKCPNCKSSQIEYIEQKGEYKVHLGRFNSMTDTEKKQVLHKRTKEFNSKPRETEYKQYLERNFTGKIKGLDKN
jgi:hypothetical protein